MTTLNLEAKQYTSSVLTSWAQSRPGALKRMGAQNAQTYPVTSSDSQAMAELFQPITAASGFAVTDKTAMLVSTVYACLSKISGAVLQLPIGHYRELPDGERKSQPKGDLWWMLNQQPHDRWTSASWKEWIVRCVALRGDQFTRILRSTNPMAGGKIIGLEPLHSDEVTVRIVPETNRLAYDLLRYGISVDQDDMLHFAGFGFDGLRSLSAVQWAAKQAIGNALAGAEFSGRTIGEGAMPQIALEFPNKINPEQAKNLRDSFVATYTGVGARKLPLVLTEGGKATELSISPVDLQLLESRRFEKEDICQALGVPPILIGDNDKTSSWGTGIEQITIGFVKYTVKPMLCRWEEELNRKLFRNAGQYIEFELDGLLRGDSKAQAEVFKAALGGPGSGDGYMTVNEVRKLKNLPKVDGGDELFKAQTGTAAGATPGTPNENKQAAPATP